MERRQFRPIRRAWRRIAAVCTTSLAVVLAAGSAPAQLLDPVGPLQDSRWLPPGSNIAAALSTLPAPLLRSEQAGGHAPDLVRLGELAFRAPGIFGGLARESGLSCQTCHANGHLSADFFVPGLSDRPGSFDPTNALFNRRADDGLFRPLNIPSLRGVAMTAPYGRDGRFASLRSFTRHVIVNEFAGDEPPAWLLDALVAYQHDLAFPPAPALGPGGRLTAAAPPAAKQGERLFRAPFRDDSGLSCASCHPPHGNFTDGRRYDVGTGGTFTPPSLRGLAASAPYLHDGSLPTLAAVVARYDEWFVLGLSSEEEAALSAYLATVGASALATQPVTMASDLDRIAGGLPLLAAAIAAEDLEQAGFLVRSLRQELGLMHNRFPDSTGLQAARTSLVRWSRQLQRILSLGEQEQVEPARQAIDALAAEIARTRPDLEAREAESFYNPERLAAAIAGN